MTQGNYGRVETANSKAPLFMVAMGTVLIEHKIIDPKDRTTRTAISKLWPVYCVPGMTMCLLSTGQLLQSGLSIEGTMDGSTFCDSSGDAVLSALPNLWGSIQVVRTCIIKNNVPNPVSLVTRHPDYETIHRRLGHISDEAMRHVPDNVEGAEKVCFPNKKHVCRGCALGKLHQRSFPENSKRSSETLGLIHSDLLELPTLSYSKYKWVITFFDDYSSYCRVAFLCKKSDAAEAIKAVFRLWSKKCNLCDLKHVYLIPGRSLLLQLLPMSITTLPLNVSSGKRLRRSSQMKNLKYCTSVSLVVENMCTSPVKFMQINLHRALNS